jgi:BirA family biotin operon repressor/biotin-[acetyl-CoA-carboxylase] ligase
MTKKNKNIIFLNRVNSTNNYANQLILSNAAEEGTVVMAQFQENGKGQAGNKWESETGKNLLTSIILFPKFLLAGKQFQISKAVSLSILEFLVKEIDGVSIKWPNDIYVTDKKIAGILIENSIKGNYLLSSIVGIGLNLNQENFVSDAPNPISLKQLTGIDYNPEDVILAIKAHFFKWYKKLLRGNFHKVNLSYFKHLYQKEVWQIYSKQQELFDGKIVGIGEFGQLQIEKRNGAIEEFMFKEVEFVP